MNSLLRLWPKVVFSVSLFWGHKRLRLRPKTGNSSDAISVSTLGIIAGTIFVIFE